ncbi:MAG: radical SAM protein [Candidatus Erginobacter occultus]|nr:radical SAM protein [Candidatus Erginobacter occultus]
MQDSFKRKIDYLRISLTDRCNLRCRYCMPAQGVKKFSHRDILSFEEIERVIRVCRELGFTKFRFTGGEPLVRRGVMDFLEQLPPGDWYLTTNLAVDGLDLDRLNRLPLAGLNVSCDSLKPDRYRWITRLGELSAFLQNLAGVRSDNLKINAVVMKGFNEDEIEDFIDFGERHRATVRFIEKMDFASGGPGFSSLSEIKKQLITRGIIEPEGKQIRNSVSSYHDLKGRAGKVGFITPVSRHFCPTCSKIRLKANGEIKLCVFAAENFNLRDLLRSEPEDGVIRDRLAELIARKPFRPEGPRTKETMAEIGG